MRLYLVTFIGFLCSAGCTMYDAPKSLVQSGVIKQRVFLTEDNFRVVKSHVQGQASCPHILMLQFPMYLVTEWGFPVSMGIPLGDPDILEQAMADLHSKCDLKGKHQHLHNLVEEYDITNYLGLYADFTVTVSAEVIEFIDTKDESIDRKTDTP